MITRSPEASSSQPRIAFHATLMWSTTPPRPYRQLILKPATSLHNENQELISNRALHCIQHSPSQPNPLWPNFAIIIIIITPQPTALPTALPTLQAPVNSLPVPPTHTPYNTPLPSPPLPTQHQNTHQQRTTTGFLPRDPPLLQQHTHRCPVRSPPSQLCSKPPSLEPIPTTMTTEASTFRSSRDSRSPSVSRQRGRRSFYAQLYSQTASWVRYEVLRSCKVLRSGCAVVRGAQRQQVGCVFSREQVFRAVAATCGCPSYASTLPSRMPLLTCLTVTSWPLTPPVRPCPPDRWASQLLILDLGVVQQHGKAAERICHDDFFFSY